MKIETKRKVQLWLGVALIIMTMLIITSFTSASIDNLGTVKQRNCIQLPQTCASCTYNNISSVQYPDKTYALNGDYAMQKTNQNYNLTFCNTEQTGGYSVAGHGDVNGVDTTFTYSFDVSPSGNSGSGFSVFIIVILAISIGLIVLGFAISDASLTILGSFALTFVGLYTLFYGIDVFKNQTTNALSIILMAIGGYIGVRSGLEVIEDM